MGGTQSKPDNFIDISSFDIGDVVLFTEKGGKSFYNVRYCKWISYSFAAFVVNNVNGGVELCGHFPSAQPQVAGQHSVVFRCLESELQSGKYHAVYARRLVHPPTPEATKAIQSFASEVVYEFAAALASPQAQQAERRRRAMSKHCTHSDEEIAILMGATTDRQSCVANPVEHFTTSRLVAEMLLEADLVTGDGHIFSAVTHDEKVLAAVKEVELKTPAKGSSSKKMQLRSIMNSSKSS